MRKLIVSMNMTLDGFMAGPDGDLDWHFPLWNDEMSRYAREQLLTMDTILLGRITYETMAGYWPMVPEDDFGFLMNHYTKVVFSEKLGKTTWQNSMLVKGDMEQEIERLKRAPGRNMIIYGSGSIVRSLAGSDLIDEYRIWVHPVLIGSGKPMFGGLVNRIGLNLLRTKVFSSGVTILFYQPATKIHTDSGAW